MRMRVLAALLGCLLARPSAACEGLVVEHGWVRLPPPGAPGAAAYFSVLNTGTEDLRVTEVSSARFAHVMLHETRYVDGQAQMRHVGELNLAPGERVVASPGGLHIMLHDAEPVLRNGEAVAFEFLCGERVLAARFEVRKEPPP